MVQVPGHSFELSYMRYSTVYRTVKIETSLSFNIEWKVIKWFFFKFSYVTIFELQAKFKKSLIFFKTFIS